MAKYCHVQLELQNITPPPLLFSLQMPLLLKVSIILINTICVILNNYSKSIKGEKEIYLEISAVWSMALRCIIKVACP